MLRRRVLPQAILSSAVAFRCTSSSSDLAGHVRRYESERSERQKQSSTSSINTSTAGSAWLARLQRESVSEHDPLQGRYHPDYFRDPARGYEPMFAPRNYAEGGAVAHQHHLSDETYVQSFRDREQLRHEHELNRREARGNRQLLRDGAAQQEAANPATGSTSSSTSVVDMFRNAMVEPTTSHYLGSFQSAAAASSQQQSLQLGHERATFLQGQVQKQSERYDNMLDEGLRTAHGLRELERHEFDVKQRMEHIPFRGYDMDRYLSINKAHGSNPFNTLGNVVAPGSTAEAQANVRRNSVSERDAQITRAWSENTVRADPRIGESLTEEIVSTLHSSKNTKSQTHEQARNERFGIGRQRPLVHDGGPDSRTIQRHKNDERLLRALTFREHAYRKGMNDEHADPFHRNNVDNGVGHLLRTKFDVDRRAANFAAGKADVTERATQYLGKQVQQEIDEFVLRRRNARGERPLEYFRPFPTYRDMRLQKAYRDVEGFPLMRSRPEFLEWELFTRYRAHFEQRRLLALKHGLEPRPNETVQERDARREKLDAICENTPFDASLLTVALDEQVTDAAALRAWFGHYLLPSPTIVKSVTSNDALGLFVNAQMDPLGTEDRREHVLSSRYFNTLFLNEAYRYRIGRGNVKDLIGSMPEISAAHQQPPSVLKHFSKHERAVYDAYMASETQKQTQQWTMQTSGKRWIAHKRQFGVRDGNKERSVDVMDVERVSDGSLITIAAEEYAEPIRKALADSSKAITIDNEECRLLEHSRRNTRIFEVKLDDGSILPMEESEFSACETEAQHQQQTNQPTMDVNHAVNAGLGVTYHYNRSNYIETQDAIWEERCANRSEGWSPATHADGLRVGLPVMARRLLSASSPGGARGGLQRGVITQYLRQPFFNPEPRTVSVAFGAQGGSEATGEVEHVPLDQVHIWQRQYYGPERTAGEATRKLNASSRRYVNVADPNKERVQQQQSATEPHFLEKYKVHSAASIAEGLQSVKEIAEIDTWTANFDTPRSDNYRPLTINHRKDYVKGKYFHRYTPWDWIMTQEADQPLIWSQLRTDDIGPSYHHSVNRYWRYKARPHGYVRNFENEVRDLFQYVDGVTPWEKAKKLRTYWEVREHHPIPQFNRPEVAIHRNHMGLLPSQLWDTDKKTGRVKSVKDSVRDYQTTSEIPLWGR